MNSTTEQSADGVGILLKQARLQQNLSIADVANHLRLKPQQIEQIEAEQWDPTVSMTYMRGYLRAYARFLKLSELEILQNFELQAAYLRLQAKPMHSFSKKHRLQAAENRFMLATYVMIVLLIGLFLVWFWQTHLLDSQPVSVIPAYTVVADPDDHATVIAPTLSEVAPVQVAAGNLAQEAVEAQTNTESMPAAQATDVVANRLVAQEQSTDPTAPQDQSTLPNPEAVDISAEVLPALDAPSVETTDLQRSIAELPSTQVAETATSAATPVEAQPPVSPTASSLTMTFTAECWLEVVDADGRQLAYGLMAADRQLTVQGKLPFQVKLGNAAAAALTLNNQVIDLSGYKSGQIARLTLDGQL